MGVSMGVRDGVGVGVEEDDMAGRLSE